MIHYPFLDPSLGGMPMMGLNNNTAVAAMGRPQQPPMPQRHHSTTQPPTRQQLASVNQRQLTTDAVTSGVTSPTAVAYRGLG